MATIDPIQSATQADKKKKKSTPDFVSKKSKKSTTTKKATSLATTDSSTTPKKPTKKRATDSVMEEEDSKDEEVETKEQFLKRVKDNAIKVEKEVNVLLKGVLGRIEHGISSFGSPDEEQKFDMKLQKYLKKHPEQVSKRETLVFKIRHHKTAYRVLKKKPDELKKQVKKVEAEVEAFKEQLSELDKKVDPTYVAIRKLHAHRKKCPDKTLNITRMERYRTKDPRGVYRAILDFADAEYTIENFQAYEYLQAMKSLDETSKKYFKNYVKNYVNMSKKYLAASRSTRAEVNIGYQSQKKVAALKMECEEKWMV